MTRTSGLLTLGALVAQTGDPGDVSAGDGPAIVPLALAHGLGPMLLWTARQAGIDPHDHPALAPLVEATHQTAMASVLLERAQRDVDVALRAAGIPALWLKGAALAHTVYPEPTLRPMVDLDVLVPYEQRERALEVVQGLGYDFYSLHGIRTRSSGDELARKLSAHHYHLRGGVSNAVILELHSRLLGSDDRLLSLAQLDWFWAHTETIRAGEGWAFDTLTPEAHLLYGCAHAILQHGEAQLYLLRFFDLHQIITRAALDWPLIVDQAVALGWTLAVERALRRCMAFFATPVPAEVLEALVARRPAHEHSARVIRLQGPGHRWERLRDKLGQLSPRERAQYVFSVLLPSPSYMRQRYPIRPGWPTWPYYFYRWWDQGRDVAWATWKRLTRRYG